MKKLAVLFATAVAANAFTIELQDGNQRTIARTDIVQVVFGGLLAAALGNQYLVDNNYFNTDRVYLDDQNSDYVWPRFKRSVDDLATDNTILRLLAATRREECYLRLACQLAAMGDDHLVKQSSEDDDLGPPNMKEFWYSMSKANDLGKNAKSLTVCNQVYDCPEAKASE